MRDLNQNKQLAIELTKALIQNSNVKPVFDQRDDVAYILGDTKFTFSNLVDQFLTKIEAIEKWE